MSEYQFKSRSVWVSLILWLSWINPFRLPAAIRGPLAQASRRVGWFMGGMNFRRAANLMAASLEYAFNRKRVVSFPTMVKIDISPLCNLHCTICVHAHPNGNPDLEAQQFRGRQRMNLDQYRQIIEQIRRKACAVSLYYLGDPYIHPDIDAMCRIAADAGLSVHLNSNFSFRFSDERIESIVRSGVTHLTVCVDGLSQEVYQRTRVGGKIDLVLSNLRRVCEARRRAGQRYPHVEVQYLRFQHNLHEVEAAERLCAEIGVDQFMSFWGSLHNYTDMNPEHYQVKGPREKGWMPQCAWPYFGTVVKYNGDVIPCCNYRTGTQYTANGGDLVLGNVFQTSLEEIWNSPLYQRARRLVGNPALADADSDYRNHFCYGCPYIFRTDSGKQFLCGKDHAYEELYQIDEKHIPVRRPRIARSSETGAPVAQEGQPQ